MREALGNYLARGEHCTDKLSSLPAMLPALSTDEQLHGSLNIL